MGKKITDTQCLKDLLPSKLTDRSLRQRGHDYILPRAIILVRIRKEYFKRFFANRCLFSGALAREARSGAPWVKKCGKLPIRENLVIT